MSVHKDHKRNTWYFVVRIDGKQYKRRNKDWTLKRHAVEAELEFLTDYNKGKVLLSTDTFKEVSDKYVEFAKIHRKPGTVSNIQIALNKHILPFFQDMIIKDIQLYDVEEFQNYLLNKKYKYKGNLINYSNNYLS